MNHAFFALLIVASGALYAQDQTKQPQTPPPAQAPKPDTPESKTPAARPPTTEPKPAAAGPGRPPILVPASSDEARVRLQLPLESEPVAGDLEAGLLSNDQYPNQRIIPKVELTRPAARQANNWDVEIRVTGLIPFGDSVAPLLHRGRHVETLRFHKPGLNVKPPPGDAFFANEGHDMLLVLENPSEFEYPAVSARVRFTGPDVCSVTADKFGPAPSPPPPNDCVDAGQWTVFKVPKYAQVTLRIKALSHWFDDSQTGFARGAKRKGILTLRFQESGQSSIFEQSLPLEVYFNPSGWRVTKSLAWVFLYLFGGALLAVCLRVAIPNYRRRKILKDSLNEAQKATRGISDNVSSTLRVLLRVERITLDQLRRDGFLFSPDFDEIALRVERGLLALKRRITYVQRLDAALCRRNALLSAMVSPTRFDLIEQRLGAASTALTINEPSEQDWVFIQQQLEAADKALGEPTDEEKQAFEAMLVQRWKFIKEYFPPDDNNELTVPNELKDFKDSFPEASLLPKKGDDGSNWVKAVGVVRADLQLTALELMRELQFLLSPDTNSKKWELERGHIARWLATPALQNLTAARSLLLQFAQGISAGDIVLELQADKARIVRDPQRVSPNQTVRLGVYFYDPKFNSAVARESVECEWHFTETRKKTWFPQRQPAKPQSSTPESSPVEDERIEEQKECGWKVNRYFEEWISKYEVKARFYHQGKLVTKDPGSTLVTCTDVVMPQEHARRRMDKNEKRWNYLPEALQLFAALLVPLAALTLTTTTDSATGRWWDLIGVGFGSETIRSILTGRQSPAPSQPPPSS